MHVARVISWLLVVAILIANHVHLAALQVPAWAGMLVNYSRDNGLAEAAEMTFDGDHPCPMCCAIEKAQTEDADHQMTASISTLKIILFLEAESLQLHLPATTEQLFWQSMEAPSFHIRPLLQPPRNLT